MKKDKLIVHCSATTSSMDIGEKEITKWHTDKPPHGNGWRANGYAYIIRRNGVVENGRDIDGDGDVEDEIGAHTKGFNKSSIGVCLVGGINDKGESDSNFTLKQYIALDILIKDIKSRHVDIKVLGHRDFDSYKDCPSFCVKSLLEEV